MNITEFANTWLQSNADLCTTQYKEVSIVHGAFAENLQGMLVPIVDMMGFEFGKVYNTAFKLVQTSPLGTDIIEYAEIRTQRKRQERIRLLEHLKAPESTIETEQFYAALEVQYRSFEHIMNTPAYHLFTKLNEIPLLEGASQFKGTEGTIIEFEGREGDVYFMTIAHHALAILCKLGLDLSYVDYAKDDIMYRFKTEDQLVTLTVTRNDDNITVDFT